MPATLLHKSRIRRGKALPCFLSCTTAHAPFFASQNRSAGNMADFGHNALPIITRLSFHSSIADNIHLWQCKFKLIRLWDNANFICNCHTYTRDFRLLSIHSAIHLIHYAQRLIFVLRGADLIHMKPACARNLSSINVNCNHSSYADGFMLLWYVVKIGIWISAQAQELKGGGGFSFLRGFTL